MSENQNGANESNDSETDPHQSNPIETPTQTSKVKRLPVIEIFGPVIQGEGSQAGQQTMFVRFGGCDYRCTKCDSLHAVIPQAVQRHRTMMTVQEIIDRLDEARAKTGVLWVTFSGGNPLMHDLTELAEALKAGGYYINVETQATLWRDWVNLCDVVTVSPKSMGMGEEFEPEKYASFVRKVERPLCVKVVIFSAQDMEMALWVEAITKENIQEQCLVAYYLSLGNPYPPVLNDEFDLVESVRGFQVRGQDVSQSDYMLYLYKELSEEVLQDPRLKNFKFLPQLHVLVYGNETGR